ncbi:MAG: hypothetical protein ACLFNR_00250 [Candidatus Paceibacterota bacterium]
MLWLIENLKEKPKHKRKFIAVTVSGGVTFLIFIFWVSSLYLHGLSDRSENSGDNGAQSVGHSPLRVIQKNAGEIKSEVSELLSGTKEIWEDDLMYEIQEGEEAGLENKNKSEYIKEREKIDDETPKDQNTPVEDGEVEEDEEDREDKEDKEDEETSNE